MDELLPDTGLPTEPVPTLPDETAAASIQAPPSPPTARTPSARKSKAARAYLIDLLTITVGVLIALSLEGLREWIQDRRVVATAAAAIERELSDNLEEIRIITATSDNRRGQIAQALRFANEMIETETSMITQLDLGFEIAEVSSASFETAARNGALALMDYEQARAYSRAYEVQEMFAEHQSRTLSELEGAAAMLSADPYGALPGDIQRFREHVLALVGMLAIEGQLAEMLIGSYRDAMGEERPSGSGS